MQRTLHRLSAWTFYLLGGSFFLAYLLLRNDIGAPWAGWWMRVGDLPLALAAMVFGGTSFWGSLHPRGGAGWKAAAIAVPLSMFFLFLITLNFWHPLRDALGI